MQVEIIEKIWKLHLQNFYTHLQLTELYKFLEPYRYNMHAMHQKITGETVQPLLRYKCLSKGLCMSEGPVRDCNISFYFKHLITIYKGYKKYYRVATYGNVECVWGPESAGADAKTARGWGCAIEGWRGRVGAAVRTWGWMQVVVRACARGLCCGHGPAWQGGLGSVNGRRGRAHVC